MNYNFKKWYTSKTLWANILMIGAAVALDLANVLNAGGTITVVALINMFLRAITDKKLDF